MRLLSVTLRSLTNKNSRSLREELPEERESWVRKTAVVDCIVLCMSERREDVDVLPSEPRIVESSEMTSRPISFGAA